MGVHNSQRSKALKGIGDKSSAEAFAREVRTRLAGDDFNFEPGNDCTIEC